MDPLAFVIAVAALGVGAGVLGALFGLGGGIFLIPALTLLFHVNIRYAIGASLIAVIATSSGTGAAYVRDRLTNIRIGTVIQVATVMGALLGAYLAGLLPARWLYIVFGSLLLYSALAMTQAVMLRLGVELPDPGPPDGLATRFGMAGAYHDAASGELVMYAARRVASGTAVMFAAGIVSGLLGIGSGAFNVLAMDVLMRLPLKVSTATSNFIIGVTAAASAGVYFARGDIHPLLAAPVALGILIGAGIGTRLMLRLRSRTLRLLFIPVLLYVSVAMILRGIRS
jgi:uncharacterized membrane protein YfcA